MLARVLVDDPIRARISYPPSLPISARRDELLATIRDHQVVVVAGETGSGKSTQLPKLCLELGRGSRGIDPATGRRTGGMIGHTQPRRVAARTIAERVADELGTELGQEVGYAVRFTDRVSASTLVKVMTDGILLAEIQRDHLLRGYDTLIVDEAHERSLNVDFLLGYLAQLLPRRSDLKVIVTSATIDTERFAAHFGGAPVVEVTGRTHPVEVRYRPIGEEPDDDRDQVQAVLDAVDELAAEGPGDVLVFLSGEREIHDVADALRRREPDGARRGAPLEVLPLYARLSAAEQHRIFQPHTGRRVVLSTNVAETSLTVPGVRYVVDAGTARISRYSHRLKVQRLPIEPISQASADQRAGRCGRVAPGVCIRLYAEDDLVGRPRYTEPEILRTNLASVILQMTALGLGDVAAFPFVDPPDPRAVRDGIALLDELGALEPGDGPARRLTSPGRSMARLPIDPRLARMLLEADRHGCVREVMVIVSALSIQDPRERPADAQEAADEAHRRFAVEGSDFLPLVRLWDHLRAEQRARSSSQFRKLCRAEFLNYLRVREWQDLYSQLRQVTGSLGIRAGTDAGHPDRVHQALLAGMLSNLGMRDGTTREFRGARGSRFVIARGSALAKRPPRWVMAAELVETDRLRARTVAAIQPEWAERLAAHLVHRSYGDPQWDPRRAGAVTSERVTLYGLPIVTGRRVGYERVDAAVARELFIRHALVDADVPVPHPIVTRNRAVLDEARAVAERARRPELADDDAVHAWYAARLGSGVTSGAHFDRWCKRAEHRESMVMQRDDLLRDLDRDHGDLGAGFPAVWHEGDLELPLTYRFEPGAPDDGVCVHIPLAVLNQVDGSAFDWQVPGVRDQLVDALVRTLPKARRRALVPIARTAAEVAERVGAQEPGRRPLVDAVADAVREVSGEPVRPEELELGRVPDHLRMCVRVEDDHGAEVAVGRDLQALRRALAGRARAAVAATAPTVERRGIVTWDLGDIPPVIESVSSSGHVVRAHPALVDEGDSVALRVFTKPEIQRRVMRTGVRRLLLLAVPVPRRDLVRRVPTGVQLRLGRGGGATGALTLDGLVDDVTTAAADRLVHEAGGALFEADAFEALRRRARAELAGAAGAAIAAAAPVVELAAAVDDRLARLVAPAVAPSAADADRHLRRLVRPGFVTAAGTARLGDLRRYVAGIERRLDTMTADLARDRARTQEVRAVEQRYDRFVASLRPSEVTPEIVELGRALEELRVAVFAEVLGTSRPVSARRLGRELDALGAP